MSIGKGYPTQEKEDRLKAEFVTVEPIRTLQHGMSVLSHMYVTDIGSDAVEANSTTSVINATAHAAQKGDVILITSGALSGKEVKVQSVTANAITLAETLPSAPATAVTFDILRHKYPQVDSAGAVTVSGTFNSGPVQFVRDGIDTEVEEDTVTPANNRPLPVKLTSVTGDINITAGDLDIQSTHVGANFDSVRIGDGTNLAAVNASLELQVRDDDANTSLATLAGAVAGTEMQVDVLSSALPTGAATEATLLQIETAVELIDNTVNTDGAAIGTAAIAIAGTDGANAQIIHTDASGDLQVDVLSSALPTGAATEATLASIDGNVILADTDNVTIVSSTLPTGAATEATLLQIETAVELIDNVVVADGAAAPTHGLMIAGYDGANAQYISTNATGQLQVGVVSNVATALDVVDFIDTTPVLDTSLTNIPASSGSPVTIVASLAADVKKLKVNDTIGEFIGVYTGAAASEVLQCIVGPGEDGTIEVSMSSGQRVSLRNMANATLSVGKICIQFLG